MLLDQIWEALLYSRLEADLSGICCQRYVLVLHSPRSFHCVRDVAYTLLRASYYISTVALLKSVVATSRRSYDRTLGSADSLRLIAVDIQISLLHHTICRWQSSRQEEATPTQLI